MSGRTARSATSDQPPSTNGTFHGHTLPGPSLHGRARTWPVAVGVLAFLGVGIAAPMVAAEAGSSPSARGDRAASVHRARAADAVTTVDRGPSAADVKKLNEAIFINAVNRDRWIKTTTLLDAAAKAKAEKAAKAAAAAATGRCGGDLPPCYIMRRESGGNIRAENPHSSASGKWQFIDSTWRGFGGYARASLAPESVQDALARQLWAGGRGCSHWSAC